MDIFKAFSDELDIGPFFVRNYSLKHPLNLKYPEELFTFRQVCLGFFNST